MTITQNVASKLVVGFVAVSMLFTLSFAPAQAATAAELEAQIKTLLAQIEALQGSTGGSSSCAAFTMDLTMGASGAEVTALQNFLIGEGHAIAAGATGYFGAQTQASLAAFQSANGISPAAGYFGPITRAKVNSMCSDDDANDDANDDDSSDELTGEASLDTVDLGDGEDTDIEEGQEDAPVAEIDVEFADGDAQITRIDLEFLATGTEDDPWDTFEEISLWVDDEEVARESADDEDAYLDEDTGTIRFSGLDIVASEDEEMTIVVAVTPKSGIDDIPATWNVGVNAIRYTDADDVTSTDTTTGDLDDAPSNATTSFDIDEEGDQDELVIRSSEEDPEATTLQLQDDERSDWITIFAYRLDTDDSTNDITVNDIPVAITVSSSSASTFVNDMKLVIDGETYDDYATGTATQRQVYTFDTDGDLVIEAGEEVTVEVMVEFSALALGNEGVTIYATSTGSSTVLYDAEGADDLAASQITGSATGETHTMRTGGVVLAANDMSETLKVNDDASTTDDEGSFVVSFDVTAFEDDIWVTKTAASGTTMGTEGALYLVEDSSGNQVGTPGNGTSTASLSSTADTDGTRFKVNEGETETFTLTVVFDPASAGFYQVQLYSLNFATSNAAPTTQQLALPAADYETDQLDI